MQLNVSTGSPKMDENFTSSSDVLFGCNSTTRKWMFVKGSQFIEIVMWLRTNLKPKSYRIVRLCYLWYPTLLDTKYNKADFLLIRSIIKLHEGQYLGTSPDSKLYASQLIYSDRQNTQNKDKARIVLKNDFLFSNFVLNQSFSLLRFLKIKSYGISI